MESLFNNKTADIMLNRIEHLNPDSKPYWGKMNVSQMLKHAQVPLQVALGDIQLKRNLIGVIFGKLGKKQLLKNEPFKKNLPTDPRFIVKDASPDFNSNKEILTQLVRRFSGSNGKEIAARPHPFFGKMTMDEWGYLQYKHLDHHLRQFGA